MKPEIIIVIAFVLITGYLLLENYWNSNKISKDKTKKVKVKTDDSKTEYVELKPVSTPTVNDKNKQSDTLSSFDMDMEKAALESINDEREEKIAWTKNMKEVNAREERKRGRMKRIKEQDTLQIMKDKLAEIDLNEEEKSFVDEVNKLSPELKATLFADLLKRKGY